MTLSATLSINPTTLKVGQQVDIESRTWPGINKPGGHATITKLHYAENNNEGENGAQPTKIDVKYVLGGTEKQIEIIYVKPHVELIRGGRSRRVDKKMNVDSFGSGGEKENNGAVVVAGRRRRGKASGNNKRKSADDVESVDKGAMVKKKKVVQPNKNKTENAAAAKIEVDKKPQIVETNDTKKKNKSAPPKKEEKKAVTAKSAIKTKSITSYFTTASSTTATATAALSTKTEAVGPSKRPSKAAKETTKKVKKTTNPTTKEKSTKTPNNTTKNFSKQVKYSPNSILAVRAAHAKSPAQSHIFGTKTIGYASADSVSAAAATAAAVASVVATGGGKSKKKKGSVQESLFLEDDADNSKSAAATATKKKKVTSTEKKSGISTSSKKKVTPSSALEKNAVSSDKSAQNHKTIQSLYKNECVKAKDFVKSMVGSTLQQDKEGENMTMGEDVTSSPESCLELEMDSGRMDLFNSLLSEVMFQKGLDSMDVDELICCINTSSQRGALERPFRLLEVKAFLKELDSQNRIFVSWEEDNTGTVYSI